MIHTNLRTNCACLPSLFAIKFTIWKAMNLSFTRKEALCTYAKLTEDSPSECPTIIRSALC